MSDQVGEDRVRAREAPAKAVLEGEEKDSENSFFPSLTPFSTMPMLSCSCAADACSRLLPRWRARHPSGG